MTKLVIILLVSISFVSGFSFNNKKANILNSKHGAFVCRDGYYVLPEKTYDKIYDKCRNVRLKCLFFCISKFFHALDEDRLPDLERLKLVISLIFPKGHKKEVKRVAEHCFEKYGQYIKRKDDCETAFHYGKCLWKRRSSMRCHGDSRERSYEDSFESRSYESDESRSTSSYSTESSGSRSGSYSGSESRSLES